MARLSRGMRFGGGRASGTASSDHTQVRAARGVIRCHSPLAPGDPRAEPADLLPAYVLSSETVINAWTNIASTPIRPTARGSPSRNTSASPTSSRSTVIDTWMLRPYTIGRFGCTGRCVHRPGNPYTIGQTHYAAVVIAGTGFTPWGGRGVLVPSRILCGLASPPSRYVSVPDTSQ